MVDVMIPRMQWCCALTLKNIKICCLLHLKGQFFWHCIMHFALLCLLVTELLSLFTKLDSMHWFFTGVSLEQHNCLLNYLQTVSAAPTHCFGYICVTIEMPHFWGWVPGGYDPEIHTRPRFYFCTVHPPTTFRHLMLIVQKLLCWQTNPQTDTAENTHLAPLWYASGERLALHN